MRLAIITGASSGLAIADIMHCIGRDEAVRRFRYLCEKQS